MSTDGRLTPHGNLSTRVTRAARPRIHRLGPIAWAVDRGGSALVPGALLFATHLAATHRDAQGRLMRHYELGSGLVTVVGVNKLVSDAVAALGSDTLANFKYMDSGLGTTAATDGDTTLGTAITSGPARVVATLSNGQTATTGNHAAILQYQGTLVYNTGMTYPAAITEWGLFDALTVGNMWDRKVFGAITVSNGDSVQYTYSLSLPSNA